MVVSFQTLIGAVEPPTRRRVLAPLKGPKLVPVSVMGMPMGPEEGVIVAIWGAVTVKVPAEVETTTAPVWRSMTTA